jgi:hypothetical protein
MRLPGKTAESMAAQTARPAPGNAPGTSRRIPTPLLAGGLVFLLAFGIFAATTNRLSGYEPETAAVAAGLVEEGHLWGVEDPSLPSLQAEVPGKGDRSYARAGLLPPLLEAPFFAAGHFIDRELGSGGPVPYGLIFLWFYNPFIAAIGAAALFALVYLTRRSLGWAAAIAGLFAFASIAWPYAKIGMETTFMTAAIVAFAFATWSRVRPHPLPWALTGIATGAAVACKPYSGLILIPIAFLLLPTWRSFDGRLRTRLLIAVSLPVLLWIAAIGWYNWSRFGSVTDFGYPEGSLTLGMPLNVLGLLFSPGKGLVFYSPLVVLGALGLAKLWRVDRWLAASLSTFLAVLTFVSAASGFWGDEVWGPRFLVAAAWTMLVPIAWWGNTAVRKRVLAGLAVAAFAVQVIGVSTYYGQYVPVVQKLTGVQIYTERYGTSPEELSYGNDPPRWIPQLSPLVVQGAGLVSSQAIERLGGEALTLSYHPWEGPGNSVSLSEPGMRTELDFFWSSTLPTLAARVAALLMLLCAAASGFGLFRLVRGGQSKRLR